LHNTQAVDELADTVSQIYQGIEELLTSGDAELVMELGWAVGMRVLVVDHQKQTLRVTAVTSTTIIGGRTCVSLCPFLQDDRLAHSLFRCQVPSWLWYPP
jgi:hypothetical protein